MCSCHKLPPYVQDSLRMLYINTPIKKVQLLDFCIQISYKGRVCSTLSKLNFSDVCAPYAQCIAILSTLTFMGTQFSFIFQFNGNPLVGELSWKIDMMSLNEVSY
ncbi:hypothetical protein MTBBW1_1770020 [Desulfamplus magnetovallimortis]|uniref:Uncharacterized protein n=1 Tax=Desulfamplus magnetovallimortis TaxID=1246637 RepID=A0A1W1HAB4_9BACT|nr:hypothetical protein MTBBW1_1770020 [Desulfamplus magnetovallimortis]